MATAKPRSIRTARVFQAIWRTTRASPGAPPPSLILRRVEPGPIGSVVRFGVRAWPGSRQTSGAAAAVPAEKPATTVAHKVVRYALQSRGDMGAALVTTREGLEASLIVGIVLA